jgi:hypothetical protein
MAEAVGTRAEERRLAQVRERGADADAYFSNWTVDREVTMEDITVLLHHQYLIKPNGRAPCGREYQLLQSSHGADDYIWQCPIHRTAEEISLRRDSFFYNRFHPIPTSL